MPSASLRFPVVPQRNGGFAVTVRDRRTGAACISSKQLVESLLTLEGRPWPTIHRGKPINEIFLGRRLGRFEIHSRNVQVGGRRVKGYELSDFTDAFSRLSS